MADEKRMQLRGLHHVTAICRDLEATIVFYRDVLGLAIVHDGPSDDDPDSRHVWFGVPDGAPGQLVSFMEYPQLPSGVAGVGSTHHFALHGGDGGGAGGLARLPARPRRRVLGGVRPGLLPVDLRPRPGWPSRRDSHPGPRGAGPGLAVQP